MYLKIILTIIVSIIISINGIGENFVYYPIPSLVPLTMCDKRYSIEMDKALAAYTTIGNSTARADLIKLAEEYMILVKHQQDLDIAIRGIEAQLFPRTIGARERAIGSKIFDLNAIHVLRRPLQNYIACKDHTDRGLGDNNKYGRNFEVNSKATTITRLGYPAFVSVGHCDIMYAKSMEKAIDDLKSILTTDLIKAAEEYMILIKQQQDIDVRIRHLELRVFSMSAINILRKPIAEYIKCKDSLRTGNYSINFYR